IRYWSVTGVQTCALPISVCASRGCRRQRVNGQGERRRLALALRRQDARRLDDQQRKAKQATRGGSLHQSAQERRLHDGTPEEVGRLRVLLRFQNQQGL